jgi:hypothetical protein
MVTYILFAFVYTSIGAGTDIRTNYRVKIEARLGYLTNQGRVFSV